MTSILKSRPIRASSLSCSASSRLNPETIKDTIARGVSNGQLGYVGKVPGERYRPFNFERTLNASDVEISDEMFIITAETAEAYRRRQTQGQAAEEAPLQLTGADGGASPVPGETSPGAPGLFPDGALVGRASGEATSSAAGMSWRGEVPAQKWMNFYTRVLTKIGIGEGLKLTVSVEYKSKDGTNKQKVDDVKGALRELGLDDRLDEL
jgi:hypothetical protein